MFKDKYILYSLAQSNALNGVSSDYKVVVKELSTWWRVTYKTLIAVFSVTTLAAIIMTILCAFVLKGKGAK